VIARLGRRATLELFPGARHTLKRKVDLERAAEVASTWAGRLGS
jgi:hypothetical protein